MKVSSSRVSIDVVFSSVSFESSSFPQTAQKYVRALIAVIHCQQSHSCLLPFANFALQYAVKEAQKMALHAVHAKARMGCTMPPSTTT